MKKNILKISVFSVVVLGLLFIANSQYTNKKAIKFLDGQFHISKTKKQIIKLESLSYSTNIDNQELWVSEFNKTKQLRKTYYFTDNKLIKVRNMYLKKENSESIKIKNYIEKKLKKYKQYQKNNISIWQIKTNKNLYKLIHRPTTGSSVDGEMWQGHIIYLSINEISKSNSSSPK